MSTCMHGCVSAVWKLDSYLVIVSDQLNSWFCGHRLHGKCSSSAGKNSDFRLVFTDLVLRFFFCGGKRRCLIMYLVPTSNCRCMSTWVMHTHYWLNSRLAERCCSMLEHCCF